LLQQQVLDFFYSRNFHEDLVQYWARKDWNMEWHYRTSGEDLFDFLPSDAPYREEYWCCST